MSKDIYPQVIEFEPVNSRIARIRLRARWFKLTVISAYAPTDVSQDEAKDEWYGQLEQEIS